MKRVNKYLLVSLLVIVLGGLGLANYAFGQSPTLDDLMQRAQDMGIEQAALDELRTKAQSRGLSNEELSELIAPVVQLRDEGLPANHVIQKTLEGLSKSVPASRIASFVDRLSNSTRQAAGVVDPWSKRPSVQKMISRSGQSGAGQQVRNDMIEASARAITQNISPESVEQVLTDISSESVLSKTAPANIVSAIGILPDLPVSNQSELARSFVVRALKGGFNAGEIQNLPMALNMAQQRSQLPAASILQGVSKQMKGGVPAAQILQNLFNGNVGGGPPGNIPKGLEDNPGKGQGKGNRGNNGNNGNPGNN